MTPPGTDGLTRDDRASCPIPQTHRRLVEAHLLWHQALDNYQEPEAFRANLNALIQALRNVTWILQSEKRTFAEFDAWYEPWQALMAEQPILRWLKDARNTVVKQGDLETSSKAIVKLATWRDDVLLEASVPPDLPPDLLLRNFPLLELMRGVALPPGDLENAATVIERRWTVPGLPGAEILETLAQAYGFLSDLVLDAHNRLRETGCIASGRSHDDFRSRHHPGGVLPCMALGSEQRTCRFDSSGAELQTVVSQAPVADRAMAAARYGLTEQDRSSAWEQLDPIPRARRVLYTAKRMLAKDKVLQRIMFLRDGHGSWSAVGLNARNKTEKHLLMRMVAKHIEAVGGDALIDVGEAWTGAPLGGDVSAVDSSERAGRGEALYVFVATRDGVSREFITPFRRGPLGGIKLGDTVESATLRPYYLEPVFDVWRSHGVRHRANGQPVRRLWEPDSLDTCYCGGPRRYGECCKTAIDGGGAGSRDSELATAVAENDLERADRLARAALAQHVIWVRQHTTPTRHVAQELHNMLLEVDIPALDSHVSRLVEVLKRREIEDVPQRLTSIGRFLGVPELGARLSARSAEWLIEAGNRAEAVKQIEALGDPKQLTDLVAARLAAVLVPLPAEQKMEMFSNVASRALPRQDRRLAMLESARCRHDQGDHTGALTDIDRILGELVDEPRAIRAEALLLRFDVSRLDEDFRNAKAELETNGGPNLGHQMGALLIEHGDFDEAEGLLLCPPIF